MAAMTGVNAVAPWIPMMARPVENASAHCERSIDILRGLKAVDSREQSPEVTVEVLDVRPHAWGIVPSSGPCHVAHLGQP